MGDLFARWRGMVARHSRRAVDAYVRELPDFHLMSTDARSRAELLDFAFFLRERTVALAAEDRPFGEDDLDVVVAVGRERGAAGVSPVAQRRVLALHTSLTLREVHEAATPVDVTEVMRTLRWLPDQGAVAQAAYTRGYLRGQEALRPVVDRVRSLAQLLLAGDAFADDVAAGLAMPRHEHVVVAVARMPGPVPDPAGRADLLADLLAHHWLPVCWEEPGEFVALVGADEPARAEERTREVVRDFVHRVGVPCAVGAARGAAAGLGGALEEARQVGLVAPPDHRADAVRYRADLFAELGAAAVPPVDRWLGETARRLAGGPDLIATLDAFYRNDLHRARTAAALAVHPRTLDYRLHRVHRLTGLDPVSARGVLVLSTAVTRALAGAYT
ncbi:helix-turn-helix domain-containing protein [Saccharothrix sp. BKS2]|uniref:helix-turn-helix domain-containing protein n=1 Tax=Saccharothrix sp. BKS2 TaxID=3064400 RepID=UPI0039EA4E4F